jgi:hypothetical protein
VPQSGHARPEDELTVVKYRQRSGVAQLAVVLGLLLGGGAGGALLGSSVASDSSGSVFVSGAMLPVGLFLGVSLWSGSAVVFVVVRLFRRWLGRADESKAVREGLALPPGSAALVPSCVASSVGAACVVSALSTEASLLGAMGPYLLAGLAYGLAAWWLARAGWFPAPDGT